MGLSVQLAEASLNLPELSHRSDLFLVLMPFARLGQGDKDRVKEKLMRPTISGA